MSNNAIKKAFAALFGSAGVPDSEAKLDAESKRLFKELVDAVDDGGGQDEPEDITRADLCESIQGLCAHGIRSCIRS